MDDIAEVTTSPRPRPRALYATGLVGIGLVAGLIVAGLNVASAQTSPAPTPSAKPAAPFGKGFRGHGGGGPLGERLGKGGLDGALHGEFTAKAPGGGYRTMAMQVGSATSVSATSITVKSEDGYSRTYAVNDDTLVNAGNDGIGDVKTGDQVRVLAVVKGGAASAVHVGDVTNLKAWRDKWAPRRPRASSSAAPSAT